MKVKLESGKEIKLKELSVDELYQFYNALNSN